MTTDMFQLLCATLGYDPASVLVIRVRRDGATVTYTEPTGMPRGAFHRFGPGPDPASTYLSDLPSLCPAMP
jgi:hypothetical protein